MATTNPFSISQFKDRIGAVARPNLFYAVLDLASTDITIPETFSFRCETAEFPGRTLATFDDAIGAGPALKLPYDVTYNDISLTIICSEDLAEREFFESWIDKIIQPANSSGAGLIAYYDDYAYGNKLTVTQIDSSGKTLFQYELNDIYPIALTAMTASWEDTNTYQRFGVTMAYRYHNFIKS